MQTKRILLTIFTIVLSHCLAHAEGLTNQSTNLVVKKMGDYSVIEVARGHYIFINPSEFWNGVWKENTNGLRAQLRIYPETNNWFIKEGVVYPTATNLMLRVEWGSAVKDLGGRYYMAPNGKFAQFKLLDAKGNIIAPNPNAGTNLFQRQMASTAGLISFGDLNLPRPAYGPHLPSWVSPASGSLVANFPKTVSTNVYPHYPDGRMPGETESVTNHPPSDISLLKLDEIYSVTNEGDYTLMVQPVLYKLRDQAKRPILDRVDLPCVTTKVHLVPKVK